MEAGSLYDLCEYCLLSQLSESGACCSEAPLMMSKNKKTRIKQKEWNGVSRKDWNGDISLDDLKVCPFLYGILPQLTHLQFVSRSS